jgi:hypothetical protein
VSASFESSLLRSSGRRTSFDLTGKREFFLVMGLVILAVWLSENGRKHQRGYQENRSYKHFHQRVEPHWNDL